MDRVRIDDAEVYFCRQVPLSIPYETLLGKLIDQTPWRQEHIVLWGKRYPQPRLTAWHGDPDSTYIYSGIHLLPLPWTDLLLTLKHELEWLTRARFNSVLLNYYRDQRDSMGMHSDDEPELGSNPVIASLSLGEERVLVFKHRRSTTIPLVRMALPSGSLLLMKGETQRHWKHGIAKTRRVLGARINLTFRWIMMTRPDDD